jgi:hypothetical protein
MAHNPAAANKAAEEGEQFVAIAARIFDFKPHKQQPEHKAKYVQFALEAIAANRASRQVANKAEVEPSEPTDIAARLRARAAGSIANQDDAKLMATAADECDRFYGGMMAWKKTAQKKDRDWNEERMARQNERCAARAGLPAWIDNLKGSDPTIDGLIEYIIATPPATTGASTVLTDERTAALIEAREAVSEMRNHLGTFGQYGEETARAALDGAVDTIDELIGEVAAQAGQVAVPDDVRNAALEEAAAVCDELHYNWKWDDEPDSNSGPRSCAKAIRALAAPSPAKESK